jgi:hypothetical protein
VNEVGVAYVRLRSDSTGYQSEVERGVRAGFSNVRNIIGGAFAAAGVFEGAKHIIEAAAEHQSAFAVVDQTLKNAHQSTELYGQSVEALLEKEARLKGFSDESLASSFIRLVSATKNSATAYRDLGLAEDVARARHIDVAVAALALSRAEQGSTQSLSRLGIVLHGVNQNVGELKQRHDEAVAAGAKFDAQQKLIYANALQVAAAQDKVANRVAALAAVQDRFGGSAAKFAQTASGQFQRTEQDIHQLEVSVGEHALPVVNDLAEGIGKYATELANSQTVQDAVSAGVHDIAGFYGEFRDVVVTIGPPLLDVATGVERVTSAIGAPALVTAIGTYKALGIATAAVATAEAFYTRALIAGQPAKIEATAANVALAASETAVAVEGEAASVGGLGTFARGVGALALGGGSAVGLAIAGVSVLAGGLVYLGTREGDIQRATDSLRSSFDLLGGALNKTRELVDAVAQSKVDVALAKDAKAAADQAVREAEAREKATRGTKDHASAVLVLKTARDQDAAAALQITQSEERRTQAAAAQRTNEKNIQQGRRDTLATTIALADAERSRDETLTRQRFAGSGTPSTSPVFRGNVAALDAQASQDFVKRIADTAGQLQAKNPGLATSLRLLEQFTQSIGTLPSKKQIDFILDPSRAHQSLNVVERELLQGEGLKTAAKRGGHDVGAALGDGVAQGIIDRDVKTVQAMVDHVLAAIGAGKNAADAHSPSRRAANEIGLPLAQGIVVGINTGAPEVQAALHGAIDQAITQGGQQVADAINQAKQNLNTIGGSIAASIGDIFSKPLQKEQAALTAEQNRLTLNQLKRSVILPGGRTLSTNDAAAERQLRQLAGHPGTNQPTLQAFLLQFEQARLAVQQDQATAKGTAATRTIADLTDRFNRGDISGAAVSRGISAVLAKNHIDIARVAKIDGIAYADNFVAELKGIRDQVQAFVGVPKLPGAGLVPSIVRPLDTLKQVTQTIAEQQKQRDSYQLSEAKKQTALLKTLNEKQQAAKFIASLPRGERAAVAAALNGAAGP